ncbi:MAG TPA: metal ABC transporter substrate-binding protein, partial [Candidatus Limnocylindrales bacterium]|nr:metal ABC transporter substrate-binding protein [Candidatus Limnocylindrales bacterium]
AASGSAGSGAAIVATTTIWGDITRQIVDCAGAGQVTTLMPVGADPHDYAPSSQDVAAMVGADLVVANGLGLEEGLQKSIESAQQDGANVFEVAPLLDPIPFGAEGEHSDEEGEEDHSGEDPHVWLDVTRAATAAALIGAELAEVTGDGAYTQCGEDLEAELTTLHEAVAATLATVPEDARILVTDHDAFGYFADAYGFTVAGVVIPGGSTLAEPSSAELAELTATVRESGVGAIFANTANPQALVDALASEVGDIEVVPLYVGSLGGPGSGAETYQDMMTENAQLISEALRG